MTPRYTGRQEKARYVRMQNEIEAMKNRKKYNFQENGYTVVFRMSAFSHIKILRKLLI